jgi:lipopolysaccharide transport system permease protein
MARFSVSPIAALETIAKSRELITQLIWREVAGRYRGSFAGLLWSFLNPLFSLAMYTFVFGVVFKARWGLQSESTFDFALVLFAGLIVHGLLAECIGRAPYLILGNPGYVKQVVFPLEILPVVALGSSLFHAAISVGILIVIWGFVHGAVPIAAAFIPMLLLPLCLIALGFGWLLSAITVYFRDIGQIVNFVNAGLLFFSPIFYPASSVPEPFRSILAFNPLTFVIEHLRRGLIQGALPEMTPYLIYLAISAAIACLGFAWFQKVRSGFADVI